MYNGIEQCVASECKNEQLTAPLKAVIDECYERSGEMIRECLDFTTAMFGDDFPTPDKEIQEPQTIHQTAMCAANRLAHLQHILVHLYARTLG